MAAAMAWSRMAASSSFLSRRLVERFLAVGGGGLDLRREQRFPILVLGMMEAHAKEDFFRERGKVNVEGKFQVKLAGSKHRKRGERDLCACLFIGRKKEKQHLTDVRFKIHLLSIS
jgi:hypothetical protein